jgi:hypothetical protein
MRADANYTQACEAKLDWLDPKYHHGTVEEMVAFGRACQATKNWRTGITLLVAEAHLRAATYLPKDESIRYMMSEPVWADIRAVHEDYLRHYPEVYAVRTRYAAMCYLCGRYAEAHRQFQLLGDNLIPDSRFKIEWLKDARERMAKEENFRLGRGGKQ